jgi:zinc transporter ZupT
MALAFRTFAGSLVILCITKGLSPMNAITWLLVYSAGIIIFSLLGGCLPLLRQTSHARLQIYLSLSAGVMLGAAFFHVMPDAIEMAGPLFGWWISLGVVGLFCVERFLTPHRHEAAVPSRDNDHERAAAVAPPVAGWMAVLGLTISPFNMLETNDCLYDA